MYERQKPVQVFETASATISEAPLFLEPHKLNARACEWEVSASKSAHPPIKTALEVRTLEFQPLCLPVHLHDPRMAGAGRAAGSLRVDRALKSPFALAPRFARYGNNRTDNSAVGHLLNVRALITCSMILSPFARISSSVAS
jgi:hypothetical protein